MKNSAAFMAGNMRPPAGSANPAFWDTLVLSQQRSRHNATKLAPFDTLASLAPVMRLRPATPADHPFLRELHHRAYREVVTRQFGSWDERAQDEWFEKGLHEAEFSVVEVGEAAVGTVALKRDPDCVHLVELQILPEHQRRGLGSALLAAVCERARSDELPLRLRVLHENHRARRLYERHGFVVTGTIPTHYLMEWRANDEY